MAHAFALAAMKRGTPRHPKAVRLQHLLGISRPTVVGLLELLYHFTAEFAPQGNIGKFTDEDIALGCDAPCAASVFVEQLVVTGWLDRDPEHRLLVHDWPEHMDNGIRMLLRKRGLVPFGTKSNLDREVIAESNAQRFNSEPSAGAGIGSGSSVLPSSFGSSGGIGGAGEKGVTVVAAVPVRWSDFERVYDAYPNKTAMYPAQEAWAQMRPPVEEVLAALAWQVELPEWTRNEGRAVPHLRTYLLNRQWEDHRPERPKPQPHPREKANAEAIARGLGLEVTYGRKR